MDQCGTCKVMVEERQCIKCFKLLHDDPKCVIICNWCDDEFCIDHYAQHDCPFKRM